MKTLENFNLLLILSITVLTVVSCKKGEDHRDCGLTDLNSLQEEYRFSEAEWGSYYPVELCDTYNIEIIKPYFNLVLGDSTYSYNYLLKEIIDTDTSPCVAIDSIMGSETGRFDYTYCHDNDVNRNGGHYPGGYTNTGTFNFYPDNGESYSTLFKADAYFPLRFESMKLDSIVTWIILSPK